jgi:hypothetical protein
MSGVNTHKFQSTEPDGAQPLQIQPQRDWNDEHLFAGSTTGGLLAYDSAQSDHANWVAPAAGAGQILRSRAAGSLPVWSALTIPDTVAQGDLVVGTAANVAGVVADVAVGSVLVSGGVGAVPAWSATPSLTSLALATPLGVGSGGTGFATYAIGDLLYASGAAALSKLADVAAGSVLVSGGVGAAPAWSAGPSVTSLTLGGDVLLVRDASNTLGQRNGTTSQALHLYGTFTDASNYERLRVVVGGATDTTFAQQSAGTGASRGFKFINGNIGFGIDPANTSSLAMYVSASGHLLFATDNTFNIGASGATRPKDYFGAGKITSASATAGIGYATGAGGTVAQGTSKSTGVTLNTVAGQITMNAAALLAAAKVSFVVTNSAVAATDNVIVSIASGGTANAYRASVTAIASTSFTVTVENITAGSLSEAPVVTFSVLKGVTA